MTQVQRKRNQLEKFQESAREFAELPKAAKIFALCLFPGSFIFMMIFGAIYALTH